MTSWSEDTELVISVPLRYILFIVSVCFAGELVGVCLLAYWGRQFGWW
jgi:hypothetical protein